MIECCTYYIIPKRDPNRRMAIHFNGRVFWFDKDNTETAQQFLFVPIGGNKYNILTCQTSQRTKGERLGVDTRGDVVRWSPKSDNTQEFALTAPDKDGWFRIKEPTQGENLGVGPDGGLVRWWATGEDDQLFKLEVAQRSTAKKPELDTVRKKEKPGAIPRLPERQSMDAMSDIQPKYLIGETLEPAYFVTDPRYGIDKVQQVLDHPWYLLRREQSWAKGFDRPWDGATERTLEETYLWGMETTSAREMQVTTGTTIKADLGLKLEPKVDVKMIGAKAGSAGVDIGVEIKNELQITSSSSETAIQREEKKRTEKYLAGKPFRRAFLTLADYYTLQDESGYPLGAWSVLSDTTTDYWTYPNLMPKP